MKMPLSDSEDDSENSFNGQWSLNPSAEVEKHGKNNKDDSNSNKFKHQKSFGWEIIEGLVEDKKAISFPEPIKGILYRRRKWPLKGWSKIYVSLESGVMAYSKSSHQSEKRNFHGKIDLGLAIVSFKVKRLRIDIDAEQTFYHLKAKDYNAFKNWIDNIKTHRLYRQYELINNREIMDYNNLGDNNTTGINSSRAFSPELLINPPDVGSPELYITNENTDNPITTTTIPPINYGPDNSNVEIRRNHRELVRTITLVGDDEIQASNSSSFVIINEDFKLIAKKLSDLGIELNEIDEVLKLGHTNLSASNPSLNKRISGSRSPDRNESRKPNTKFLSSMASPDITNLKFINYSSIANEVLLIMKSVYNKLVLERDILASAADNNLKKDSSNSWSRKMIFQMKDLSQQNMELKSRLNRIRLESSIPLNQNQYNKTTDSFGMSLSATDEMLSDMDNHKNKNISVVTSEMFYDAAEYLESDSGSSMSETDDLDDISEPDDESPVVEVAQKRKTTLFQEMTGRRDKLPAPQPDISQFSLMNLLCKNIGRDLSKVRLPVILNEPLGVLQMLCEELEYSDLLDSAAKTTDPLERMNFLVAFAISGYASTLYRARTKPFNPLIGETFEYERKDKGWKFVAEQVSHHPPVSVCYCESENWKWSQEFRLKNKFWGKSIEAIPNGIISVYFKKFNETVRWNKVTTCVYNIFGQNRYMEHYGDMNFGIISAGQPTGVSATITFHKANWSHQKYELSGAIVRDSITSSNSSSTSVGVNKIKIFGKWTEAVYVGNQGRCIWRPGAMPEDYEQYYGFTQFAIDLNNPPTGDLAAKLPKTDTRLRPDQRFLEQGLVSEAEEEKVRIEEKQRERLNEIGGEVKWKPLWFSRNNSEYYSYKGGYWEARAAYWKVISSSLPDLW